VRSRGSAIFLREGEDGGAGPLAKNIGPERTNMIRERLGLGVGDAVFSSPASRKRSSSSPDRRATVGEELKLIDENRFELCWIVDFPMYEWSEEEKRSTSPTIRSRCPTCRRKSSWLSTRLITNGF
jgi:aspartyl-tRNA synthetase